MSDIILHPESAPQPSIFAGNKGLLIAIVIGIIGVVIGVTALLNSSSSGQYQGLIQKVQSQNQQMQVK